MQRLARAGDDAGFHQLDDAVGNHLAVDAQIAVIAQETQGGFGNAADAGLDGAAVGNQLRHAPADGAVHGGHGVRRVLHQRVRGLDQGVGAADVQEGIAAGARHAVVDFHHHAARHGRDDGVGHIGAHAQAHVPVLVGRGALQQAHIHGQGAGAEQLLDLAQENGRVVSPALLHGAPHVGAQEQAVVAEMAFIFGQGVIGDAHGGQVHDFDVAQPGAAAGERMHQFHRLRAAVMNVDALARLHRSHRFIRGTKKRMIIRHRSLRHFSSSSGVSISRRCARMARRRPVMTSTTARAKRNPKL